MFRLGVLLCMLLTWSGSAQAECACLWGGPFVEVQENADLVAAVEVASAKGNSVDLHIEQVLRGDEHRKTVRLWLNTEGLCRPGADLFEPGSRWVMALEEIREVLPGGFDPNTPNISFGRVEDYSLSSCGGYWLEWVEDLVSGNLVSGARWDMSPKMSPVLLQLLAEFLRGELNTEALKEASEVDPELQRLRIETRSFLRGQGEDFRGFSDADAEPPE